MQNFIFLCVFVLANFAYAGRSPAASSKATPKNLQEVLEGKWTGFCSPQATSGTGRICHYSFSKDGTGAYRCEYYKDLRCGTKDSKTTSAAFKYKAHGEGEKSGRVTVDFEDREDVQQEKSRVFVTGDVLRVQVYEVLRMPASTDQSEAQGVVPFFEYTKAK
ncbi:hypothetical protein [Bdellovibrio sp. HCB337]|uniref:hypothetical protein n=1 Tax=Bdellovibrio sp. HCB337 TaxID=3394358 RepID=UPI0039A6B34B